MAFLYTTFFWVVFLNSKFQDFSLAVFFTLKVVVFCEKLRDFFVGWLEAGWMTKNEKIRENLRFCIFSRHDFEQKINLEKSIFCKPEQGHGKFKSENFLNKKKLVLQETVKDAHSDRNTTVF